MAQSEVFYLILKLLYSKQGIQFAIMCKAALSLVKYFHSKHFMTFKNIENDGNSTERNSIEVRISGSGF